MVPDDTLKRDRIRELEKIASRIRTNVRERKRPLVVEFSGLPKSGKTTAVQSLQLFLKRNEFPVKVITENATISPIARKDDPNFNVWTACQTLNEILEFTQSNTHSVVIVDRGIFDACVWLKLMLDDHKLSPEEYRTLTAFLLMKRWLKTVDLVILMTATIESALQREFKDLLTSKTGQIMNHSFLTRYLSAAEACQEEISNKFRSVKSINTTNKPTIDGVYEITKTVLLELEKLSDEELVVIPVEQQHQHLQIDGFATDQDDLQKLERLMVSPQKMQRSLAEESDVVLQLVVAAVLTYRNEILVITRSEVDPKNRLHQKRLVWLGGHVRFEDLRDYLGQHDSFRNVLLTSLSRELDEELRVIPPDTMSAKFLGIAHDKSRVKSARHLGIVFHIEVDEAIRRNLHGKVIIEHGSKGMEMQFESLEADRLRFTLDKTEEWSSEILSKCFNISVDTDSTSQRSFFPGDD